MFQRLLFLFLLMTIVYSNAEAQLLEHVAVNQTAGQFNYTLYNDEASGSPYYITSFFLLVEAPLSSVSAPTGWDYDTDNATYVTFFNTDPSLPYPHDIAPGASLAGFSVQSPATNSELVQAVVYAWDHTNDASGPSVITDVLAPVASVSSVPEPSSKLFLGTMTLGSSGLFFGAWKRSRRSKA